LPLHSLVRFILNFPVRECERMRVAGGLLVSLLLAALLAAVFGVPTGGGKGGTGATAAAGGAANKKDSKVNIPYWPYIEEQKDSEKLTKKVYLFHFERR